MKIYEVKYSTNSNEWVVFEIKSHSIHEVMEWTKANVQSIGICVSDLQREA